MLFCLVSACLQKKSVSKPLLLQTNTLLQQLNNSIYGQTTTFKVLIKIICKSCSSYAKKKTKPAYVNVAISIKRIYTHIHNSFFSVRNAFNKIDLFLCNKLTH